MSLLCLVYDNNDQSQISQATPGPNNTHIRIYSFHSSYSCILIFVVAYDDDLKCNSIIHCLFSSYANRLVPSHPLLFRQHCYCQRSHDWVVTTFASDIVGRWFAPWTGHAQDLKIRI